MAETIETILNKINEKVCSFAYMDENGNPRVCQMGYVVFGNEIVLHTNTWTQKWKILEENQNAAICIGHDHLADYIQLQGIIRKVSERDSEYERLESVYLATHPDSIIYKNKGNTGLLVLKPTNIKYGQVVNGHVSFFEYDFKGKSYYLNKLMSVT